MANLLTKYATQLGVRGAASAASGTKGAGELASKYGFSDQDGRELKPGEHWSNPEQTQHPDVNRFFVMNLESATPETMARALSNKFEVKHRGGLDFSIRKPGEKKWKVVDPDTWTDMIPFVGGDWSDMFGDAATAIGSMIGAVLSSPGVVTSAAGAAGGAAAVETAKQGLAKLLGGHATGGEAARSIAFEGALGGVGEVAAAAAKPVLGKLVRGGKRALLGNVDEVAASNAAKLAEFDKLRTTAPRVPADVPEGLGLREQVKQGFITASDATQTAAARGDEKLMKWLQGQMAREDKPFRQMVPQDIPFPEMDVPSRGILGALKNRGARAADDLALSETRGVAEMLDLPAETLRKQAIDAKVNTRRAVSADEYIEAADAFNKKSRTQGLKDLGQKITKTRTQMRNARGAATKQGFKESLEGLTTQMKQVKALKLEPTGKEEALNFVKALAEGDTRALSEARKYGLPTGDAPQSQIAQRLLEKETTDVQKGALGRQVDEFMEKTGPGEDLEIEHILRDESLEGLGKAGEVRQRPFEGRKTPEISPEAVANAEAEVAGMSTGEARQHLLSRGWDGEVPKSRDDVVQKLAFMEFTGGKGGVNPVGNDIELLRSLMDRQSQKAFAQGDLERPWASMGKSDIIEMRGEGGRSLRPGRETVPMTGLRKAALAARPIAKGIGKAGEAVGGMMQFPQKQLGKVLEKVLPEGMAKYVTERAPVYAIMGGLAGGAMGSGVGGGLAAVGAISLLGKGLAGVSHRLAADGSGQALLKLASGAPAAIAEKMLKPLEALSEKSMWGYRAAIYTMFHNSDVRQWIAQQEGKEE